MQENDMEIAISSRHNDYERPEAPSVSPKGVIVFMVILACVIFALGAALVVYAAYEMTDGAALFMIIFGGICAAGGLFLAYTLATEERDHYMRYAKELEAYAMELAQDRHELALDAQRWREFVLGSAGRQLAQDEQLPPSTDQD